jgi:hypothetical protein
VNQSASVTGQCKFVGNSYSLGDNKIFFNKKKKKTKEQNFGLLWQRQGINCVHRNFDKKKRHFGTTC